MPAGDDRRDRFRGVLDRRERGEDGLHRLGRVEEPDRDRGDDPERASEPTAAPTSRARALDRRAAQAHELAGSRHEIEPRTWLVVIPYLRQCGPRRWSRRCPDRDTSGDGSAAKKYPDLRRSVKRRDNAGGPHCLKYGITTNHVLRLDLVTGAGELVRLGGAAIERPGYDLVGAAVGSEGTFGIVTAVTVRLLHAAEAVKTISPRSRRSRTPRKRSRRSSRRASCRPPSRCSTS